MSHQFQNLIGDQDH